MTTTSTIDQPHITVIIPTMNRLAALTRCLAGLEAQTLARNEFEILVIDDGSRDGTLEYLASVADSGRCRYIALSQGGPARARNAGIRAARGRLMVFIGDDIYATPSFLEEHLRIHAAGTDDAVSVLGRTEWAPTLHVTPLMRYEKLGQFDYHEIESRLVDPTNLPYRFFYTSNVSVARSFLERHHLFFDEDFRHAMGEDGEFAYRAAQHGFRLRYQRDALAYHDHPTTFSASRARFRLKGEVTILQAQKHPEWADLSFLRRTWRGRLRHAVRRGGARALVPVLTWADQRELDIQTWRLGWAYDFVFAEAELQGMQQAFER